MGVFLLLALGVPPAPGGERELSPPPLELEHVHPSGAFTFRTPLDWKVAGTTADPNAVQASHDTLLVRFVYRAAEVGFDSFHVTCMLERLAGPMEMEPTVRYEYDFISGALEDRRALDSAFVVRYDEPVLGHREWRQRNVTVVGAGESLCAISYAPAKLWKRDKTIQVLLDAVLGSVMFRPRR